MPDQAQLLPGTLDLLILKAVSLGPLHGHGVLLRIAQISGQALASHVLASILYEAAARDPRVPEGVVVTMALLGPGGDMDPGAAGAERRSAHSAA